MDDDEAEFRAWLLDRALGTGAVVVAVFLGAAVLGAAVRVFRWFAGV